MRLKDFISHQMRMSHIYQPVMIKALIENNGQATVESLAKTILRYDISQVEYYEKITHNMVGRVLRRHDIVRRDRHLYILNDYETLSEPDKRELLLKCDEKIQEYIHKRGTDIWEHRRRNRRPVSGSIRYEVLKRAHFRCELCGVSPDFRGLEVDHIEPKNTGGEDSINNYQALCYTCNSQKRDTDNTDFRGIGDELKHKEEGCPFCNLESGRVLLENNLAVAFYDNYPVTKHHVLVTPKRHAMDYFCLVQAEINAVNDLIRKAKLLLEGRDATITGFNIGINNGADAGQTVFHCHVHLIPRRKGDVENPRGGVRHVIPGKGYY